MTGSGSGEDVVVTHGGLHTDYREEIRYFAENRVYSFQIESNLSCPQGCLYCYASDENSLLMKELPREDIALLLKAAARMEVRAIDWLGGDPLLKKDWYSLMRHARELGLINNIWTSGMPLANKGVARQAVEVTRGGFISVHLDTLDEGIYGQLHSGHPRQKIQSILAGIQNVQFLGKNPENMINCITLTKPVAGDVERTIRYFHEKGMRTCLTQVCGAGLARDHPEWIPEPGEIKAACETRDRIDYPSSQLSFCTMDVNKYYCGGIVCITVDGDVTPCSVIRKSVGNIHHSPIERIIEEHRDELLMTRLRSPEGMPETCAGCENSDICWGCRATAYYETGDIFGPDPKCYKNRR
jgi:radical SAM protein with 4Fe4S-binding SPASM domain